MKAALRRALKSAHGAMANSPITSRLYAAAVLDPPKIRGATIQGTRCRFVIGSAYENWYVTHFDRHSKTEIATQQWLRKSVTAGDVVFDIGANIGLYVVWLGVAFGPRIAAFEPHPGNYAALLRNIEANNLSGVTALPVAASDRSGYESFFSESHNGAASSVMGGYAQHPEGHTPALSTLVRVERVDDLIAASIVPAPSVILMDVDGGEVMALRGMPSALKGARLLIVEVAEDTAAAVHEIAAASGFVLAQERNQRRGNAIYERS